MKAVRLRWWRVFQSRGSRRSYREVPRSTWPRSTPSGCPKLAAYYVTAGWLQRLGQGVHAFPNEDLDPQAAIRYLQTRTSGLRVGGKSALALQGVRHNLGAAELVLWGDVRASLPDWFTKRFPARYVAAQFFEWPNVRWRRRRS